MGEEKSPLAVLNFHEMELDDRILKAIAKLGWQTPTLIQERAIPLLLEGKDVLVRARTGSGKTAAFSIPVIQKILNYKRTAALVQETKAIILAPSKELCHQICDVIQHLTIKCSREVRVVDIAASATSTTTTTSTASAAAANIVDLNEQKPLLIEKPDIIIATPGRLLKHMKVGNLDDLKKSIELIVIDEADLVFSFGYEDEVKELMRYLPKIYQAILSSATLSEDVKSLKSLVLHNPVTLRLEEPELAPTSQLTHYHLLAEEMDKATILYALLKLRLIRGKTIIFVNTVDKCYKIKLFLEQFAIRTCVLNSELPAKIRCHSINQFNSGIYEIIIASDEKSLEESIHNNSLIIDKNEEKSTTTIIKKRRKKDKESGASRGIDFQYVANVINFDFPLDIDSYIHRAGRTARGNNHGSVLSFVNIQEKSLMEKVEARLKSSAAGQEDASIFKAYQFKLDEVEPFKYRAKDAWRAVTRIAVREARLKEIKQEIFNCQKLKAYFDDNPIDLQVLRHDRALHTVRIQQHLADVPEYIVPPTLKNLSGITTTKKKRKRNYHKSDISLGIYESKKNNPLMSMDLDVFNKNKRKKKR